MSAGPPAICHTEITDESLKFGQLTLGKIIKIVATRCQILRLKCTKFNFGCGSAPDTAGELTALPDSLSGLRGPTAKEKGGEPRGGEGTRPHPFTPPPIHISGCAPVRC